MTPASEASRCDEVTSEASYYDGPGKRSEPVR